MMNKLLNERIIFATKQLFKTTFNKDIEAAEPYLIETDSVGSWDTSGVVSITGAYSGLIAIRLKKALTEALLHEVKMSGHQTEIHELLTNDMVGELTNIIAGNTFSGTGMGDVFLSIPVTIQGENHIISWSREPKITIISFSTPDYSFNVETELKKIDH